ncbi:MAG: hypothetical protein ABW186_16520 [Rhodanobacteraceae bacterium]
MTAKIDEHVDPGAANGIACRPGVARKQQAVEGRELALQMLRDGRIAQHERAPVTTVREMAQEAQDRHVTVRPDIPDMQSRCGAWCSRSRRRCFVADETRGVQSMCTDERGIGNVEPLEGSQIAAPEVSTIRMAPDELREDLARLRRVAFLHEKDCASEIDARTIDFERRGRGERLELLVSAIEVKEGDARVDFAEIEA